ncbi:MAG: serine/threonine-protein phosphatase [Sedimentisphaerales bacterium]|nr:serine/threonine-protein phosphatase [Sedimentisphaerales bacterium]
MSSENHSLLNGQCSSPVQKPYAWAVKSDTGIERAENEDAFYIESEIGLFMVSDGMGGHQGGDLAARVVVEDLPVMIETRLYKLKSGKPASVSNVIKKCIRQQNEHLRLEGDSESGYKNMGATVVLALLRNDRAFIANLGDSRAYRLRKDRLVQISRDHSVVFELLDAGHIESHQAENHEAQGQLTQYLGMVENAHPYLRSFRLQQNDRLLLCSDGLTDMINDREIAKTLNCQNDPQSACHSLIQAANAAGGHDNVTVLIIDWLK